MTTCNLEVIMLTFSFFAAFEVMFCFGPPTTTKAGQMLAAAAAEGEAEKGEEDLRLELKAVKKGDLRLIVCSGCSHLRVMGK